MTGRKGDTNHLRDLNQEKLPEVLARAPENPN
jgi:hypothetical protein